MNEDIKEILDTFKELTEDYSASSLLDFEEHEIPCIQLKMVLDYITNLQQEVEELREYKKNATRKHWQQKCAEHHVQEKIYKSRCQKVIEYIKKLQENDDIEIWRENGYWAYILNILNGSDENE